MKDMKFASDATSYRAERDEKREPKRYEGKRARRARRLITVAAKRRNLW
jgi:hypothetical protein